MAGEEIYDPPVMCDVNEWLSSNTKKAAELVAMDEVELFEIHGVQTYLMSTTSLQGPLLQ